MRTIKNLTLILVAGLSLAVSDVAKADISDVVVQFGTKKLTFTSTGDQYKLTNTGTGTLDLSAYTNASSHSGNASFTTFCVEPDSTVTSGSTYNAVLNYNTVTGYTSNTTNTVLKNGAAWLYNQYATNSAYSLNSAQYTTFKEAIKILNGQVAWNTSNTYVQAFLSAGFNQTQALANYMVGNSLFTGSNSVFVVQLTTTTGGEVQDFIYVAGTPSSSTPEPATVLLWSLGSLGALGMSYLKRRRPVITTIA
jgi:hypothetical protein